VNAELGILIADDHPIFRQGLRQAIEREPRLKVLAEAADGQQAIELIGKWNPDVAVLDINMPVRDGFAVVRSVREKSLETRPIFLTMYKDEVHLNEAISLGVKGYILKDSAVTEVVNCIKSVTTGQMYISPLLSAYLLERGRKAIPPGKGSLSIKQLTATELRILALLAEYKTSKEIAVELGVSVRTVENHRANICSKLSLHGTHALVKFAILHKADLV
jgi:DNA-binding NarL/FixJ family response regulator